MLIIKVSDSTAMVLEGTTLKLTGDLRLASLSLLSVDELASLCEKVSVVDCTKVTYADSSSLSLFVYLRTHNQNTLEYINFPDYLIPLVELYDLESVLRCLKT